VTAQLDRVLKGAKPGDPPFERLTKFDLRIDLRTAQAMGIELSPTVIARSHSRDSIVSRRCAKPTPDASSRQCAKPLLQIWSQWVENWTVLAITV
jgi:hypothetical protein